MRLEWDTIGERFFETGVDQCVLYPISNNAYPTGIAWNGITGITESPSGADANPIYADNIKYLNLRAAEEFGCTATAYTYPDEFAECDGSVAPVKGLVIGQQSRKTFGLCYRTRLGNDTEGSDHGYKLHLVYGLTASPSERGYATINDSPEAIEFSWEMNSTPVKLTTTYNGAPLKPTSVITVSSEDFSAAKMAELEDILYGTAGTDPRLPLPDEVISLMGGSVYEVVLDKANATVEVGSSITLKATVSPAGTAVAWSSSDTSTATVSNGVVTGAAVGTTTITATISDTDSNTYMDTCRVRVVAATNN